MTDEQIPIPAPRREESPEGSRSRAIVPTILVILVGAIVGTVLLLTAPEIEEEEELRPPKIVQVIPVEPGDERIAVRVFGTVIPARQVVVMPEVRGRVVRQHRALVPGGRIPEGEELVAIDRSDYELDLVARQAALEEAQFALEVERGRQVVASREWSLLEKEVPDGDANRSLVLREPHLRRAEALVASARNDIARVELDLERTSVPAPFNALVLEESVEVGQLLERGTAIATLAGTDEFWVRVAVPVDRLRWIALPQGEEAGAGALVRLEGGDGSELTREGRVLRLLGDLEPSGRMARLLVSVRDPLGLRETGETPLLLGSYVEVEIEAGVLENVIEIRRAALREGERIWVVDGNDRLGVREVEVLWARRDSVLIPADSIRSGERLVVSGLRLALPGMPVDPRPLELDGTGDGAKR